VVKHRAEIAHIKPTAASFTFPKMTGVAWRRAAACRRSCHGKIDLSSLAIHVVLSNYMAFEVHVAEDDAMNDVIQVWLRIALLCALFFLRQVTAA
jgi:hypothetical protein